METPAQARERRERLLGVYLVAGAFAGTAVDLSLYPLDTIKTRLHSKAGFVASGGFRGVYKGLSSVIVGSAPGASLFFGTYEFTKAHLNLWVSSDYAPMIHMASASVGEVAACLVRVPTEVTKQRTQAGLAPSSVAAATDIWKTDGLRGFYRGFSSTVMREIPFAFIQFPIFEALKARVVTDSSEWWKAALCGSFAGGIAAAITTPLDVTKSRIMLGQAKGSKNLNATWGGTLRDIYVNEGRAGLFAGVVPRVTWISIGGFVFFGAYEFAKGILLERSNLTV